MIRKQRFHRFYLLHPALNPNYTLTTLPFFHCAEKVKLVRNGGKREVFSGGGGYLKEFDTVAGEIKSGLTESRFVSRKSTLDIMELLDECRKQLKLVYPFEKRGV